MIRKIGLRLRQLKKLYMINSIKKIISSAFTIIAAIGILTVGGTLYLRYIESTEKIIDKNNILFIDQVNQNLDNYLRNMMKISNAVYYQVIKKANFSTDDISEELNLLYEANKDSLVSICIFSEYGQVLAAQPLTQVKEYVDPRQSDWFVKAKGKSENLHFSTPHVQNLFIDPDYKYRWVVSLSRAVDITNNGKISSGVLLVDMNFTAIEQLFKNVSMDNSSYIYLIDGEGEIIYHPRQQLIYANLIDENNIIAADYEDGNHKEKFQGSSRLVTVKTVGYTGWKIVCVTPMNSIISNYSDMGIFSIFIILLFITIIAFTNVFVSSRITNPITELEKSVKRFESGESDIDILVDGSYEVRHLAKAIKSMVNQMHVLMDNIVKEQEAKRKSELNALQAQINPHFLYNTLDSIIWMIENENYDGAIKMVTALAKLFRISLSKGKNIIPLRDEIEHVRNYLTIQSIRYKNKFEYFIECDENTLNLCSIKLIIQPLVENAIKHGMEFMDGEGEVVIKAYIKESDLFIDVIDNGFGMTQENAEAILNGTAQVKGKGSGIGLKNVNERIKIYFGDNYGLSIFSELDEGTTVRIHMPYILVDEWVGNGDNKYEKK
ncbi:sensor histidine kinase [Clostridioides difficile]